MFAKKIRFPPKKGEFYFLTYLITSKNSFSKTVSLSSNRPEKSGKNTSPSGESFTRLKMSSEHSGRAAR